MIHSKIRFNNLKDTTNIATRSLFTMGGKKKNQPVNKPEDTQQSVTDNSPTTTQDTTATSLTN